MIQFGFQIFLFLISLCVLYLGIYCICFKKEQSLENANKYKSQTFHCATGLTIFEKTNVDSATVRLFESVYWDHIINHSFGCTHTDNDKRNSNSLRAGECTRMFCLQIKRNATIQTRTRRARTTVHFPQIVSNKRSFSSIKPPPATNMFSNLQKLYENELYANVIHIVSKSENVCQCHRSTNVFHSAGQPPGHHARGGSIVPDR